MSKRSIQKSVNKKQIAKEKQNNYYNEEAKKLVIIVGVVVLIFVVAYLIIGIFVTKEIKWFKDNDTKETTTIQYKKILAGETFNQNKDSYYVIFTASDDFNYPVYESLSTNNTNIYIVDLANALNTSYISEENTPNAQSASDLKVKKDTMIKIENKTNILYIESKEQILAHF